LHLDSLGRVQLAAAIEQKLGMPPESGLLESVETLGQLRAIAGGTRDVASEPVALVKPRTHAARAAQTAQPALPFPEPPPAAPAPVAPFPAQLTRDYVYPHWPWRAPVRWLRNAFVEAIMRPLVWFLAAPRVQAPANLASMSEHSEPMLIVANHVTAYDGPLVQYALPGPLRRNIAAAMAGDMLDDFRHFRNPEKAGRFSLFAPLAYWLITALFNVFPLPRSRDFQRSFTHAGEALDHGLNVLIFPEGTRSAAGQLAPFRAGIGLLVRQSDAPVLPVAIRGLGELKQRGRGWFRSGRIEVRVGEPIRFAPEATENEITERLHSAVAALMRDSSAGE
jgi:long-chain acyl-CoA synthetase